MLRKDVDIEKISPMMRQYLELKEKVEDAFLFFRLGDFYELFFEDALKAAPLLEIALTSRDASLPERVPMCGVPHHSYEKYVEKLIDMGYKVAIAEQMTEVNGKMIEREIVQVITKGTRLNLSETTYNFVGSLTYFNSEFVLAYGDISTGETFVKFSKNPLDDILRLNISEVIAISDISKSLIEALRKNQILVTIRDDLSDKYSYIYKDLEDFRVKNGLKHLVSYLISTKMADLSHLQKAEFLKENTNLLFDSNTARNLELVKTLRKGKKEYSLLWLVDKTKTAMGSRLLEYNLLNPSFEKDLIERRQNFVELFLNEFILADKLRELLAGVYDLERIATRISLGNVLPKDLEQLLNSLEKLPDIAKLLEEINFYKELDILSELKEYLKKAITVPAPKSINERGLIKTGFNEELDRLREEVRTSKLYLLNLEKEEQERTGISKLKVGFNKVFGYYIEISKGSIKEIKPEWGYVRKQTLANAERYITDDLKRAEEYILKNGEKEEKLELELYEEVRKHVKEFTKGLQENAKTIALLDMILSFAKASEENGFVKPKIIQNKVFIKGGKHPVVEKVNDFSYVLNDIVFDDEDILLITGPNMAGKSTYMRQMAITVILNQIGCFVPAKSAKLMLFDKIFTRIGASDDLVGGDSTFMVEMKEANFALRNATKNSLVIFDELGRGTSTYDGMALALSIINYFHDTVQAKLMFSTHYHELTQMTKDLNRLTSLYVSATVEDGNITFLHKVKKGAASKSYGVEVASLANLPKKVIKDAKEYLYDLEELNPNTTKQISFYFEEKESKTNLIEESFKNLDINNLTPLDALNFLYHIKEEVEKNYE